MECVCEVRLNDGIVQPEARCTASVYVKEEADDPAALWQPETALILPIVR